MSKWNKYFATLNIEKETEVKDGVKSIIGKTINSVIVSSSKTSDSSQLFITFSDGTYYEIYGESFTGASGVMYGGVDDVLNYVEKLEAKAEKVYSSSDAPDELGSDECMGEVAFRNMAKSHLIKLASWFFGLLLCVFVSSEMVVWVDTARGWQSDVLYVLFYLVRVIALLGVLIFGFMIFEWFVGYKKALSESKSLSAENLMRFRREVVGPLQWNRK